jgi:hypothetical protein
LVLWVQFRLFRLVLSFLLRRQCRSVLLGLLRRQHQADLAGLLRRHLPVAPSILEVRLRRSGQSCLFQLLRWALFLLDLSVPSVLLDQ